MTRGRGVAGSYLYVGGVAGIAAGVLAVCVVSLDLRGLADWGMAALLFLGLFVLAESLPVRLLGRRDAEEFTTSATFAYALLLAVPLPVALLGIAAGTALGELRPGRRQPLIRVALSVSQATVAFSAGGLVLAVAGARPELAGDLPAPVLLALLPSGLVMYTINVALTGLAVAIDQGAPLRTVFGHDLAVFDMLTHVLLLAFAPVFVLVREHSFLLVPLLLLALAATHRSTRAAVASNHDSRHDSLTGLPNRRRLDERLGELVSAHRSNERFAVMLMDLDRFKQVNDALGHQLGDLLLVEVARRLTALAGVDTVARVGGDEFAFVVRGRRTGGELRTMAQRIIDVVTEPYTIEDVPLQVGASIGIATFPDHGHDAPSLLRRADSAMYGAKRSGEQVRLALVTDERRSPGRIALVGELEAALTAGELRLDYQPQLELASRAVVSLEALLRWDHPRHGHVVPGRFVETVEQTQLLPALTRYVIERALLDEPYRHFEGGSLPISVNISARDLLDRRLPGDIADLLSTHGVRPSQLTLEVTENGLLVDRDLASRVMCELADLGLGLSIDDFGTGYSSLASLRDLPVTEVKIERSFVAGMTMNRGGQRIVRAIIELAQDLDLRVVAEGIEHPAELQELERLGCGVGQGYLLCRPLSRNDLTRWLRREADRLARPDTVASTTDRADAHQAATPVHDAPQGRSARDDRAARARRR